MAKLASFNDLTLDQSESRYELLVKIASGGMATVYVGRLRGAVGFWRLVAIKRAHAHLLEKPLYKQMLVDEARLASRLHHPNVVAVLDVEELAGELRLVMDYVEGAALSDVIAETVEAGRKLPPRIAVRIALDACAGLHAAHELCDENGAPLGLVHRDVSPHNILVGLDGVARLSDFGIAKQAEGGVSTTTGTLKGKLAYMAPEYVTDAKLDARSDVFSLGVVVWEALAGQKLFRGVNEVDTLRRVAAAEVPALSSVASWAGEPLDAVLAAALARSPDERFGSAQAFGNALETAARKDDLIASPAEVGAYVRELVGAPLEKRRAQIRERTAALTTARPASAAATPAEATPAPEPARTPADGAREASSITLQQSSAALDNRPPAANRWRAPLLAAVLVLGAGIGGAVMLQRGGGRPAKGPAITAGPAPSASAPAPTVSAPLVSAAPPAPSASASTSVSASASAPPPAPRSTGKLIKTSPTATPTVEPALAPNPY